MFERLSAVFMAFCLLMASAAWGHAESLGAANVREPAPRLITAGQPTEADLLKLKAMGVTKIINLRSQAEKLPFDEKAKAQALDLEYVSLPIAGAADLTRENVERLDALLADDQKVFLHCASGNRAGALLALREHWIRGVSGPEALALGRAAGLTSLESAVKSRLNETGGHSLPADPVSQK